MLSRFIAISLMAVGLPAIAFANGSEGAPSTYQVGSIDYIGYDTTGANGLPVCGPCAEKTRRRTRRTEGNRGTPQARPRLYGPHARPARPG